MHGPPLVSVNAWPYKPAQAGRTYNPNLSLSGAKLPFLGGLPVMVGVNNPGPHHNCRNNPMQARFAHETTHKQQGKLFGAVEEEAASSDLVQSCSVAAFMQLS